MSREDNTRGINELRQSLQSTMIMIGNLGFRDPEEDNAEIAIQERLNDLDAAISNLSPNQMQEFGIGFISRALIFLPQTSEKILSYITETSHQNHFFNSQFSQAFVTCNRQYSILESFLTHPSIAYTALIVKTISLYCETKDGASEFLTRNEEQNHFHSFDIITAKDDSNLTRLFTNMIIKICGIDDAERFLLTGFLFRPQHGHQDKVAQGAIDAHRFLKDGRVNIAGRDRSNHHLTSFAHTVFDSGKPYENLTNWLQQNQDL
jgi:hypothetical protein